jgi:Large eukaryotic DNA virus major capsid protein/Major capsid protein N-terminus
MTGGLLQMACVGRLDYHLTGNPHITFFRQVYRRHSAFAVETVDVQCLGAVDFGAHLTVDLPHRADLVSTCFVRIRLPAVDVPEGSSFRWLDSVGHRLLRTVRMSIGGQPIDAHTGEFLHISSRTSTPPGKMPMLDRMLGNVPQLTRPLVGPATMPAYVLLVPLAFWFCKGDLTLVLPMVALQHHQAIMELDVAEVELCCWASGPVELLDALEVQLRADYVFLSGRERAEFAKGNYQILVEQVQINSQGLDASRANVHLTLNHPVKEIFWVVQRKAFMDPAEAAPYGGVQAFNYTDGWDLRSMQPTMPAVSFLLEDAARTEVDYEFLGEPALAQARTVPRRNPLLHASLLLNGVERFSEMDHAYFDTQHPFQYHTSPPPEGVNFFSFAVAPEKIQPSGSVNFTKIDSSMLKLELMPTFGMQTHRSEFRLYAVNYNVLTFQHGMAGLAFR